jgi:hypothetical protein
MARDRVYLKSPRTTRGLLADARVRSRRSQRMHTAPSAAVERPDPTLHRVAFVPKLSTTAPVVFVVVRATGDGAVDVEDERAGADYHRDGI